MAIPCPSCGKLSEATPCPRCGCELGTLFDLHHGAENALAEAAQFLRDGEMESACEQATRSWELRHSTQAAQVAFLAAVGLARFPEAMKWRARALH